jgi:hypothetical protein
LYPAVKKLFSIRKVAIVGFIGAYRRKMWMKEKKQKRETVRRALFKSWCPPLRQLIRQILKAPLTEYLTPKDI